MSKKDKKDFIKFVNKSCHKDIKFDDTKSKIVYDTNPKQKKRPNNLVGILSACFSIVAVCLITIPTAIHFNLNPQSDNGSSNNGSVIPEDNGGDSAGPSNGENNSTNIDKDDKNMKRFYVDAIYDKNNNAFSLDTGGFSIDGNAELHSKQTKKKLSNCIVGDYLEVYYNQDETIVDEIIVDEANLISIKLTKLSRPGAQMDEIDLIPENNIGVAIRHETVFYVMNADGTFSNKKDLKDGTMIYGVYRKEDNVKVNENHTIHFLVGLYSYLPRIN